MKAIKGRVESSLNIILNAIIIAVVIVIIPWQH